MSDTNILEELEESFDYSLGGEWTPEYSFSGSGDFHSDVFGLPGGRLIAVTKYIHDGDYDMELIGEKVNDQTLDPMREGSSITHKYLTNIDSGNYILHVEAENDSKWEIDLYFTPPPDPDTLPIHRTGRGHEIIGPIPYSGFMKCKATACGSDSVSIEFADKDGKQTTSSPYFRVDGLKSGQTGKNSETEIFSNQSSGRHYCFARVDCNDEWEVEITSHG